MFDPAESKSTSSESGRSCPPELLRSVCVREFRYFRSLPTFKLEGDTISSLRRRSKCPPKEPLRNELLKGHSVSSERWRVSSSAPRPNGTSCSRTGRRIDDENCDREPVRA